MAEEDLLRERLQQEQAGFQASFEKQWQMTSQRFGPNTGNPQIESARSRALSALHQQWAAKADALMQSYNKKLQSLREVDRLIPDPVKAAEVKQRLLVPEEVEQAMFPKPEASPLTAYSKLHEHESRVKSELGRFETEGPGKARGSFWGKNWMFGGGARGVETPGGGVLVVEEVFDEKTKKTKKIRRNATPEETRQWAELKAEEERIGEEKTDLLGQIRRSDHTAARLRMAAAASPRMGGGTFAQKAVQPKQETKVEKPKRDDPLGLGL